MFLEDSGGPYPGCDVATSVSWEATVRSVYTCKTGLLFFRYWFSLMTSDAVYNFKVQTNGKASSWNLSKRSRFLPWKAAPPPRSLYPAQRRGHDKKVRQSGQLVIRISTKFTDLQKTRNIYRRLLALHNKDKLSVLWSQLHGLSFICYSKRFQQAFPVRSSVPEAVMVW